MKPARILLILIPLALAVVFFAGILPRLRATAALGSRAAASARPVVNVVVARLSSARSEITLPAAIEALQDTPIYARTTGYIASWSADIGDRVKAGQVLAVIDGPDLDQELNQARATLAQAKANLELARISADRWKDLGKQNAVAQQDVDQKVADYAAGQAGVTAAQAAIEIFHIAETDILRVFVSVPQSYVRSIRKGLGADVLVPEFPGRVFHGEVARFSSSLDSASRTLLTEVRLANPKGELFPGMFGEVRFAFQAPQPAILLPSNAAVIAAAGTLVATVDASDRIHLVPVTLGRDFGSQIEIVAGLEPGTRVVAKPSDSLVDGLEVTPVETEDARKP